MEIHVINFESFVFTRLTTNVIPLIDITIDSEVKLIIWIKFINYLKILFLYPRGWGSVFFSQTFSIFGRGPNFFPYKFQSRGGGHNNLLLKFSDKNSLTEISFNSPVAFCNQWKISQNAPPDIRLYPKISILENEIFWSP